VRGLRSVASLLNTRMTTISSERVLTVCHWSDDLFSFRVTRNAALRFENGQFVMVGLQVGDKPLLRAYSIASANYEAHLEFFSIKTPNGALTSRLMHLRVGEQVLVSQRATGTLVIRDLHPGRHLYLLCTGTGLAPFISIIKDPQTYERFDKVVLVHGVRHIYELAYGNHKLSSVVSDEYIRNIIGEQLIYYPTVTREPFRNQGRISDAIRSGRLFSDLSLPRLAAEHDRAMVCGSPTVLAELRNILDEFGLRISRHIGALGDYVVERAFVESRTMPKS
jgi:ferredoxin/flavodoxin---NADP+ reductase